jgi:hypothetical protein
MSNVGLVSSVDLPTNLYKAIHDPIVAAGHKVGFEHASGDYDSDSRRKMRTAVRKLVNTTMPKPDLLIATGGLVAAKAVSDFVDSHDDVPFLVCVGRAPNEGSSLWGHSHFIGGINLDTANQNTTRATLLRKRHSSITSVSHICLLYNKNSHMAAKEAREWSFFGLLKESSVEHGSTYHASQFVDDFKSLPRGTQAVIVSSDPFFASKAADLTAAAHHFAGPICYPNSLYQATAQKGVSMIHGADLKAAYDELCAKALAYLSAHAPKPKTMGLDTPLPVTHNL